MTDQAGRTAKWFVSLDGDSSGPITLDQLVSEVASGDLDDRDLVWREGMADWEPLPEVEEIIEALKARGLTPPRAPDDDCGYEDEPEHSATLRPEIPVGRTGLAIAAGYLGLVSLLFPLAAAVAIPVSILAILQLKKHPEKHGMRRAVFGLIGGVLGIIIGIAIIVTMG